MSSLLRVARALLAGDHPACDARPATDRRVRPTGSTEPVLILLPAEVRGARRIHRPGFQGLGA